MKFKKDEWALCFFGGDSVDVRLVRIAENVYSEGTCLVHMGSFVTRYNTSSLHKLPTSMKKLIPKDREGRLKTTI